MTTLAPHQPNGSGLQDRPLSQRTLAFVVLLFGVALALAAIDNRSLWTDEIGTWELTLPTSFAAWATGFGSHYNSDGQLPLYHAYMWAWVQLFGDHEWTLRAANLPWLLVAVAGLHRLAEGGLKFRWLLTAIGINAFLWYYLNEARPYVLYIAGAFWMLAGMRRMCRTTLSAAESKAALHEFLFGSVVLIGGSILGVFWIGSCVLTVALLYRPSAIQIMRDARKQWGLVVLATVLGGGFIAIAVNSHFSGARAAQTAAFSVAAMGYGIFELLGAAGLGPSRHDLRSTLLTADRLQLVLMAILAALSATAVLLSWWRLPARRLRLAVALAAGLPLVAMVALGVVLHWRVVGRHLGALFPLIVLGHAAFLGQAFADRKRLLPSLVAAGLLMGLAASALSVRWAPRHGKDDYRQAAAWTQEALRQGRSVLWLADERALAYYGLATPGPGYKDTVAASLTPFSRYPKDGLANAQWPDEIVFSPREGVDPGRRARHLLESGRYERTATTTAFDRYERLDLAKHGGTTDRQP